ncbi:hypothetical protein AGABI1DRAFT_135098 [Agaricus bisporus var. burnettii JB137-S8]|uniref:Uncharacterized protein n=1 Tax=Agaricus bisporus var. burnettii (strain JB137-S8 / ATCC MYA-4627 / FGSC 10392) TaxID=597362 RepID=K5WDI3_AGABU|nr:uncharacterized protein AGABI1DRAFT_135098 [Agaricus bisporus var. burnettii JB137-S8]EKM73306.1 hypothetical protein AGABI1DRAFT_135098 [Agaricus bisporus var. burnettii JB137-S8]
MAKPRAFMQSRNSESHSAQSSGASSEFSAYQRVKNSSAMSCAISTGTLG